MRILENVEYQGFWGSFWDLIWWFFVIFAFAVYLMALFSVIGNLFRDHKLGGWAKAAWFLFLIVLPVLAALIYLIARGDGMARRSAAQLRDAQEAQADYIRSVASSSPADTIAQAKQLLDSGAITAAEFETLKAKALS